MLSVKSVFIAIVWTPRAPDLFPAFHSVPVADLADAWNRPSCNDCFIDIGIDTQYQYLGDPHSVTVRAAWIHENHNTSASQTLGLADNANNTLRSLNVSASYIYDPTWSFTAGGVLIGRTPPPARTARSPASPTNARRRTQNPHPP